MFTVVMMHSNATDAQRKHAPILPWETKEMAIGLKTATSSLFVRCEMSNC